MALYCVLVHSCSSVVLRAAYAEASLTPGPAGPKCQDRIASILGRLGSHSPTGMEYFVKFGYRLSVERSSLILVSLPIASLLRVLRLSSSTTDKHSSAFRLHVT